MSFSSSEDEPLISSEEEDAADFAPAPPLHPATHPEVIEISSEEENDDNLDSSDTLSNVDTDAETEVQGGNESGSANEPGSADEEPWFRPIGNRPFNALVPPDLLNRPQNLRMPVERYELLYNKPFNYPDEGDSDSTEVDEEEQEEEEPLIPLNRTNI